MKTFKKRTFSLLRTARFGLWFWAAGVFLSGCQNPAAQSPGSSMLKDAAAQRVCISNLTDFAASQGDPQKAEIKTYVELLDDKDNNLKKAGVFRFELYDYKPLHANPRGVRRAIWPDIDLTELDKMNRHWKEYLKSYEFHLPLEFAPAVNRNYILEATFMADNKRIGGILKIRYCP